MPDCARIVNMFNFVLAQCGVASLWVDYVGGTGTESCRDLFFFRIGRPGVSCPPPGAAARVPPLPFRVMAVGRQGAYGLPPFPSHTCQGDGHFTVRMLPPPAWYRTRCTPSTGTGPTIGRPGGRGTGSLWSCTTVTPPVALRFGPGGLSPDCLGPCCGVLLLGKAGASSIPPP